MFIFNYGKLRDLRRQNNLTQAELGRMFGCSGPQIGRLENGETSITADDLARLSYILGEADFQAYFVRRE